MTDIRARIKTIIERELSVDNRDEISGVNDAVYALTALFSERENELTEEARNLAGAITDKDGEIIDLRRQLELAHELIDGCESVISIWGESPAQKNWAKKWNENAKAFLSKQKDGWMGCLG